MISTRLSCRKSCRLKNFVGTRTFSGVSHRTRFSGRRKAEAPKTGIVNDIARLSLAGCVLKPSGTAVSALAADIG